MGRKLSLEVDGGTQNLDVHRGPSGGLAVEIDGERHDVKLLPGGEAGMHRLRVDGQSTDVHIQREGRGLTVTLGGSAHRIVVRRGSSDSGSAFAEGELAVSAPMSGVVTEVLVIEGTSVSRGDPLLVVVAMKMNNEIRAPLDGVVRSVHTQVGESVDQGALLVVLEAGEES